MLTGDVAPQLGCWQVARANSVLGAVRGAQLVSGKAGDLILNKFHTFVFDMEEMTSANACGTKQLTVLAVWPALTRQTKTTWKRK